MILTHHTRRARLRVALAGLFLLVVAWPSAAFAHARPVATDPVDGQVVVTAPDEITVSFDEPVSLPAAGNQLLDADGTPVEAEVTVRDDVLSFAPTTALARGTYVVSWRVVSTDTHPVAGGFTFSVGAPSTGAVEVPSGSEQREVNLVRIGAELVRYAGLLAMVGIIGFIALIAPGAVGRSDLAGRRLRRTAVVAGVAGALAQFLLMPISAVWESGQALSAVLDRATWSAAMTSPTAMATNLVLIGTAVALAALRLDRLVLSMGGAAVALGSLVVVGHTRSFGPAWLVLAADLTHVVAAAIWWGGVIALTVCLTVRPRLRARVRGELIARFSAVAGYAVLALVIAGVVLYWRIGHSWSGLWESGYGRLVLLKSILVLPVFAVAAWNRLRLMPKLATRDDPGAERLLTTLVRVEVGLLAAVLTATAVLATQTPPARESVAAPGITARTIEWELDDTTTATVVITPVRRGVNAVQVAVTDENDQPIEVMGTPDFSVSLKSSDIGPLARPLSPSGPSAWEATVDLPLPGEWTVTLAVRLGEFSQPVVSGTVEVP